MVKRGDVVGVLMGGLSTEREVSLQSGAAVVSALREKGWYTIEIDADRDVAAKLREHKIDVAYLALHGKFGEDGCVQGMLEQMGIPYTGSDVRSSAVAMDKLATKRALVDEEAIVMTTHAVVRRGDGMPELELPVVVKPLVGGSTLGISICKTLDEVEAGILAALELHAEVLIEPFVTGEEITVAVLDGVALPVVRIVPDGGFFDYEAKYTKGKTVYECPAVLPAGTTELASTAAVRSYEALGCSGLCRADFIVRPDGVPVFLEINTIPGMTATSLSPMAAQAAGISFADLVERVLLGAECMDAEVEPW